MRQVLILIALTAVAACGQQDVEEGEHVWKDQVQTMDKARAVEQTLEDAQKKRRQSIEEQTD